MQSASHVHRNRYKNLKCYPSCQSAYIFRTRNAIQPIKHSRWENALFRILSCLLLILLLFNSLHSLHSRIIVHRRAPMTAGRVESTAMYERNVISLHRLEFILKTTYTNARQWKITRKPLLFPSYCCAISSIFVFVRIVLCYIVLEFYWSFYTVLTLWFPEPLFFTNTMEHTHMHFA